MLIGLPITTLGIRGYTIFSLRIIMSYLSIRCNRAKMFNLNKVHKFEGKGVLLTLNGFVSASHKNKSLMGHIA